MTDDALLADIIERTAGQSRADRGKAARTIALLAQAAPERIVPYSAAIADGLHRPEARTRRELLEAVTALVAVDARNCEKAIPGAEASLYDDTSGAARLAAFRFLARYGATTENRSERVWPLIDEALQCYHGDPEFRDMLTETIDFAQGHLSPTVRGELHDRMAFDAANTRGQLGRRAREIVALTE